MFFLNSIIFAPSLIMLEFLKENFEKYLKRISKTQAQNIISLRVIIREKL